MKEGEKEGLLVQGGYPGRSSGGSRYGGYSSGLEVDFGPRYGGGRVHKGKPHPEHRGAPVRVGAFKIFAGGLKYLRPEDLEKVDIVIPLEDYVPTRLGQRVEILACPWRDMGPPPEGFEEFLREQVIPLLEGGKRIMVYCIGSHGRTGTFIASLIALKESREETPDPIAAVRKRHCDKAVETLEQAASIFALRGEALPEKYKKEFYRAPIVRYPVSKGGAVRGITIDSGKDHEFAVGEEPLLEEMSLAEFRHRFGPDSATSQEGVVGSPTTRRRIP